MSRHLNLPQLDREYTWNDNGQLVRISGPQESRAYRYSDTNNNGKEKASTAILLAHEIGHAYWNTGNENYILENAENPIRKTLSMCLRTEYYNVK